MINSSATRLAPPTSPPSTSAIWNNSLAFEAFTDPPYRILIWLAISSPYFSDMHFLINDAFPELDQGWLAVFSSTYSPKQVRKQQYTVAIALQKVAKAIPAIVELQAAHGCPFLNLSGSPQQYIGDIPFFKGSFHFSRIQASLSLKYWRLSGVPKWRIVHRLIEAWKAQSPCKSTCICWMAILGCYSNCSTAMYHFMDIFQINKGSPQNNFCKLSAISASGEMASASSMASL